MRTSIFIISIFLSSCTSNEHKDAMQALSSRSEIINYLKTDFHISPDTSRIDSGYKRFLVKQKQSLETDSLISSHLFIKEYKPLQLNFIRFDNYFGWRDTNQDNHFTLYLIEDIATKKFYLDYINNQAGMIIEDYCMHSTLDNKLNTSDSKDSISAENIKAFNSINSTVMRGENEFIFTPQKNGLQLYLNATFRFNSPDKRTLDSLFFTYDHALNFRNDTLLNAPKELFDFLRVNSAQLRSQAYLGNTNPSLIYLKSQISLLLLQIDNSKNDRLFFWIYKSNQRLRVRRLLISGNKTSSFCYFINEYTMCF